MWVRLRVCESIAPALTGGRDMTIDEYVSKINWCEWQKGLYVDANNLTNRQIEDLNLLRGKLVSGREQIETSATSGISKLSGIAAMFNLSFKCLNSMLGNSTKVFKGPEYSRANESIGAAISKIDNQLGILQGDIAYNNGKITQFNSDIAWCRQEIARLQEQGAE